MPADSVDAIVCDPPYELGFMGKKWDGTGIANDVDMWRQALRVLKPGGHLLAFGGTRTYHRMTCAIEDAGFEIRDCLQWLYGSGFPKSHNISKAIDKAAGATRKVVEWRKSNGGRTTAANPMDRDAGKTNTHDPITKPATPEAQQWDGWGTALKPANEPIVMARKPFKGTVANNVLQHGTGGINIDATRVPHADAADLAKHETMVRRIKEKGGSMDGSWKNSSDLAGASDVKTEGRWPANVIMDEAAGAVLDAQSGNRPGMSGGGKHKAGYGGGMFGGIDCEHTARGDNGGASRFFYCAKASRKEREQGCEALPLGPNIYADGASSLDGISHSKTRRANVHPTVKPISLMRYLVRLVTPPGGTVLDPFTGSGTTGMACAHEGFDFIGCELSPEYAAIAETRIGASHA